MSAASLPSLRRFALFALAATAAAVASGAPAQAVHAGGCTGYAYAGLTSRRAADGITGRITPVGAPSVAGGHVAAWLGVGGAGLGPGGSDEWLQVGISSFPDGTSSLYYEYAQPGSKPRYVKLAPVVSGRSYSVAVHELRGRHNVWRVWVGSKPVSAPLSLPGSHGAWAPTATGESWDGGVGACNSYAYRFSGLRVASGAGDAWGVLGGHAWFADPGFRTVARSSSGFVATAG